MADNTKDQTKKTEVDSTTRRGEEVTEKEGKEAGRKDTGTEGPSDRPTGTSTGRDMTGVGASKKNPNSGDTEE